MSRPGQRLVCLALLVILLPFAPAAAQVVEETADVTVVEVPVSVHTRDGEPVRGLRAADFELYDRGRRQRITGFDRFDLSATGAAALPHDLPSIVRRRYLLLFDLAFSSPAAVARSRLAARDFVLRALHPSDLAAVMVFDLEVGPRFLVSFTSDRGQLARALDTLGAPSLLGSARVDDPLSLLIEAPGATGTTPGSFGLSDGSAIETVAPRGDDRTAEVLAHLRSLDRQLERGRRSADRGRAAAWLRGLAELGRILGSVDGRKRLICFSEGFDAAHLIGQEPAPAATLESLEAERGEHWLDTGGNPNDASLRADLRHMLEQLRRSDTVVDAVDLGGLAIGEPERRRARRATLATIARGSGGELHEHIELMRERLAREAVTYVLSFEPEGLELDSSFHPLEVRLVGAGDGRVSHRRGYFAPRPFAELHPLEKSLLASGAIVASVPRRDLRLDAQLVPFRIDAGAYVPVILEIDGPSLLDGHASSRLEVEIFAYVTDQRGAMLDFLTHRAVLDLALARPRLEARGLKFYGHLELGPGRYLARILVRNAATGRTSVRAVDLPILETEAEPRLLPPFFLGAPSDWILVREKPAGGRPAAEERLIYPFLVRGEPFVPALRPALRPGEGAEVWLVAYGFEGPLSARARVLSVAGRDVEGGRLEKVERLGASGRSELLAHFDPRNLEPGEYMLEITLSDGTENASAAAAFSVTSGLFEAPSPH
ncbi:MAG: VWA domain-containing protein [bacterium]|nr:VWA domain-containing protein [bacterium]